MFALPRRASLIWMLPATNSPGPTAGILAQPRRTGGQPGFPGDAAPRISQGRIGVAGFGLATRLPEADGRVAGHGGHDRLHQTAAGTDCSLRKAARGNRSRAGRCSLPPRLRWADTPARFWSRVIFIVRPKIEGNDRHPASLGGTDIFSQASILGMYDPDRSQTLTYLGDVRTWGDLVNAMRAPLSVQKGLAGCGHSHPDSDGFLADAGRPVALHAQGVSRRPSGMFTSR